MMQHEQVQACSDPERKQQSGDRRSESKTSQAPDGPETDQSSQGRDRPRRSEGADSKQGPNLRVRKDVVQCDAGRPRDRSSFDPGRGTRRRLRTTLVDNATRY